jgi:hypothetical protein
MEVDCMALSGNRGGSLEFLSSIPNPSYRPSPRKTRPPMPVVTDADLNAPQRLPKLRGFWWKPDDWKVSGTGRFVAPFDPLAEDAPYLAETVFNTLHGWPKVTDPAACIEEYAREYGGRAAKSLRWRYRLPVTEQALVSTYREFLTRCLLGKSHEGEAAPVLDMQDFRLRQAREARAAAEAEKTRIAASLTVEASGQLAMVL